MALKNCKECGNEVSTKADKCPNCGAPIKAKQIGCFTSFFLIAVVLFVIGSLTGEDKQATTKTTRETVEPIDPRLEKALAYLKEIQEIGWVEIENNHIYIGWNSIPNDLSFVNRAAAVHGNRAIGSGFHVWSVDAGYEGWRPGDAPYYCETTARGGKVTDSSCN